MLTNKDIAECTKSNQTNVDVYWPILKQACDEFKITGTLPLVGFLATIGVEDHFKPIHEIGTADYFKRMYGKRKDYEVDEKGLWKWRGRGFIQLTGIDNYKKYGTLVGVDLVSNPDQALEPKTAARIAACYYRTTGCDVWAARGHWLRVRELVNGKPKGRKPNGWIEFSDYVWDLLGRAFR